MATGLATFDQFSWGSLLKGRLTLLVDRDRRRALRLGQALEEAGAIVTLAPSQPIAYDRWRDASFSLLVLVVGPDEPVSENLRLCLVATGAQAIVLGDPTHIAALRATLPGVRIGDFAMSDRDIVMFVTGTPDE